MNDLQIVRMIVTTLLRRGTGKEEDPIRIIIQYWDQTGKLIFEVDKFKNEVKYYGE